MKKPLVCLSIVLALVSLTGCQLFDSLFFNTEEVSASELNDCGTGAAPANKDEALLSVSAGIVGAAGPLLQSQVTAPSILDSVFSIAGGKELYAGAATAARQISPSTGMQSFIDSIRSTGAGKTSLTLTAEDFDTDGFVSVDGTLAIEAKGLNAGSTSASGKVEADVKAKVSPIVTTPFNGGVANIKLKANGDATIDGATQAVKSINGYSAIAVSLGVSLKEDALWGTKAGKYVMSFKYTQKYAYSAYSSSPVSDLELTIYLKVYNNAGKVVGDYTYTQADIQKMTASY